eukprot:7508951-Pyramimonas_sp.AAC.1
MLNDPRGEWTSPAPGQPGNAAQGGGPLRAVAPVAPLPRPLAQGALEGLRRRPLRMASQLRAG